MPDIIHLLPDSVANQIAAGEVIQRPASVVKELLENSIDAQSTVIRVVIKDAGRTLIQVIDNGTGMSETDARMCFERHATSKIRSADDLFHIKTLGFRGEAMASIVAVAQVEMKTKRADDTLGTQIIIEGTELKSQTPCACPQGTNISVKNLFFNVPARRNFLKSDSVELRHIIDEFQRVAIAYPEVAFSLHHNNSELFHLNKGTFRQRLVGIFGVNYNQRLVPVEESTTIANISGFIGKPEYARKSRGEQFFFVNRRFIRNSYLHHAVQSAYEQLLPSDAFPSYFINIEINPRAIDVNIHPTKTEIKFEDERSVYTIIRAAVKQSLGKYNIAPSLDFEQEQSIDIPPAKPREEILINPPKIRVKKDYNPFLIEEIKTKRKEIFNLPVVTFSGSLPNEKEESESNIGGKNIRQSLEEEPGNERESQTSITVEGENYVRSDPYQLHNKYIIAHIKTGMVIIDQQAAHERILYEKYYTQAAHEKGGTQQLLFPQTFELSPSDAVVIKELHTELQGLGFDINEFGRNTFIMHGVPAFLPTRTAGNSNDNVFGLLEKLIEDYKQSEGGKSKLAETRRDIVARIMAKNLCIKAGETLNNEEMTCIVDELFGCKMPYASPSGKPTLITISLEEIEKKFKKG